MRTATYQSAYAHYGTSFLVNGARVGVIFKDASNGRGIFTTTDKALQEAIEADDRFGATVFLLTDYGYKKPVAKVAAPKVPVVETDLGAGAEGTGAEGGTDLGEGAEGTGAEGGTDLGEGAEGTGAEGGTDLGEGAEGTGAEVELKNPITSYPGIKTVQLAAKALRTDFEVTAESVGNKAKLLAVAESLNVTFPDLV